MSSGIQSLLKTEKEAAEIVNEARKYRTNRLKTAKQDAQEEIENYKKQKEEELNKFEKDHEGINEQIDKDADAEVEKELKALKEQFEKKKSDVIKLLVDATISSNPELHINANVQKGEGEKV
ncbi:VMA10 [Candida pseudojiufengensis]|uniref:VMA10 n=1 Tax=Candida pseudojiufengensis TaxID=497109 RepID=UPI002224E5E1|nr:VMA10 [Candida pseudojiufengensis]KAI5965269.1 VMA10 [Candida pseudojiufengensis]